MKSGLARVRRCWRVLVGVGAGLMVFGQLAGAATVSYETGQGGETKEVVLSTLDIQGVAYASLQSAANQLGGSCQLVGSQAQVDMLGQTAWIGLEETSVDSSAGRFTLGHAITRQGTEVLMAVGDVVPFFQRAFHVELRSAPALSAITEPPTGETPPVGTPGGAAAREAPSRAISVVVIDPGHGGTNGGAVAADGYKEKDLTLAIALKVKAILDQSKLLSVVLTRESDVDLSARERVNLAIRAKGDLYISLHAGASPFRAVSGLALFVSPYGEGPVSPGSLATGVASGVREDYSALSLKIAKAIGARISAATAAPILEIRAVRTRNLKDLPMPAVLVEVGYLTNPDEGRRLQSPAYQAKIADGLAKAILKLAAAPVSVGAAP